MVCHPRPTPPAAGWFWVATPSSNRHHHTNTTASMDTMVRQRRRPHARYLCLRQHPAVGHEYLLHGPVGRGGLDGLDLVQDFQALRDAPKDHVLAVQPRGLRVATGVQGRATTHTRGRTTKATAQGSELDYSAHWRDGPNLGFCRGLCATKRPLRADTHPTRCSQSWRAQQRQRTLPNVMKNCGTQTPAP